MSSAPEDSVLRSARREACVVFLIWLTAMIWSVSFCYARGYGRAAADIQLIFGFPDWVFWGIVVPWVTCTGISIWFGATFVRDEDLGEDVDECGGDAP
jgi:hypothetical protein